MEVRHDPDDTPGVTVEGDRLVQRFLPTEIVGRGLVDDQMPGTQDFVLLGQPTAFDDVNPQGGN